MEAPRESTLIFEHAAIATDVDLIEARRIGRSVAERLGFTPVEQAMVATAISELARNIIKFAGSGDVEVEGRFDAGRPGVTVRATDEGPGIVDVELAMQDGYSTGDGLGLGLPGVRRLMDEIHVDTRLGKGTTVTATKWKAR